MAGKAYEAQTEHRARRFPFSKILLGVYICMLIQEGIVFSRYNVTID